MDTSTSVKPLCSGFLTLCVLLLAPHARAQETDPLKQLSLEQLSQIDINSVNKADTPAFQTPAAISVLTSSDIRRSGARNIPDLLRLIPGVNVAEISSSEWAIGTRGFQDNLSRSMLVLIDGRSVYTPLFAGVYWDMQDVMIEDVDRIEVIRGPGGTIWGSNAVNGVINIITKSARETQGTLVSAGAGNVDQGFLNWRYGAGTDDLSYRVYGKGFSRSPLRHGDQRNFDDWRRGQIGFRMDWSSSGRDSLTIQGDAHGAEAGERLRISQFSPPSSALVDGPKSFNGQNVLAVWRRVLRDSDLQIRTYYDRTDREQMNYREVRHTFDFDFLHHIPRNRQDITWGLGARISPSRYFLVVPTVDFLPHQQTYNIFSAFLQDEITLLRDRLVLTLGTKLEHTSYSGFNYQPSARLAWTPNAQHTIWGAVTRAVRTASRIEDGFNLSFLSNPSIPSYLRLAGDGEFTPEQLIGYEFGFRKYFSNQGFIGVSLFHNRYDDLLSVESRPPEVENDPAPPHVIVPLLLRNGLQATGSGGEITGLWDVTEGWRARASYSYVGLDAKRKPTSNDASTVGQVEGDTARHKVILQSYFDLPKGFELDLIFRYVSGVRGHAVPAYSTGDARIAHRLGENFLLELVGRNLLQPSHPEYGGIPGPLIGIRRAGFVALTWTP